VAWVAAVGVAMAAGRLPRRPVVAAAAVGAGAAALVVAALA
jgi:hypothetical protein